MRIYEIQSVWAANIKNTDLKKIITEVFSEITKDVLCNVFSNYSHRLQKVVEFDGGRVENDLSCKT